MDGVVLVHDAARPFADVALVEAVARAAAEHGAALPVLAVVDTVKRVREGRVVETLDRAELGAAQTPQGFRLAPAHPSLRGGLPRRGDGHRRGHGRGAAGGAGGRGAGLAAQPQAHDPRRPRLGRGRPARREGRGPGVSFRVGHGFDAHRLVAGRPLAWAASRCPTTAASRATPTATASCTRSATRSWGRRRRGTWARTSRAPTRGGRGRRAGSSSRRRCASCARAGYEIENVDVTVVAQEPTLAPHLAAMRESLAGLLGLPVDAVSVKAKSTDGLGAIGRGEGIAAEAVALLRGRP